MSKTSEFLNLPKLKNGTFSRCDIRAGDINALQQRTYQRVSGNIENHEELHARPNIKELKYKAQLKNFFGKADFEKIAQVDRLDGLSLQGSILVPQNIQTLASRNLKVLDLSNTNLDCEVLDALPMYMPNLKELYLHDLSIAGYSQVFLEDFSELTHFGLTHYRVDEENSINSLKKINGLSLHRLLDRHGRPVNNPGHLFAGLTNLKHLNVSHNLELNVADVHSMRWDHFDSHQIKSLNMYNTGRNYGDNKLSFLQLLKGLQYLRCGGLTKKRPAGEPSGPKQWIDKNPDINDQDIRSVLHCSELTELSVRDATITNEGMYLLPNLENLERLDIRNTNVDHHGISFLQKEMPNLQIEHDIRGTEKKKKFFIF